MNMKDFEVHEIGAAMEIKLARALAKEITNVLEQYGNVIPQSVIKAHKQLTDYQKIMLEREIE